MYKHILVPTDGSELSTKVISQAVRFAKDSGAKITFYFARPNYPVTLFAGVGAPDQATLEIFSKAADQQAEQILTACEKLARDAGVICARASTVDDSPYRGIIDAAAANGCELIFMASHGRHGLNALLLGSETNKVLTHTTIPVLVCR